MGTNDKLTFNQYVDKAFWALMIAVAGYASVQLKNTSDSIAKLNEKMAVVIVQLSIQTEVAKDHETRIRRLETP